MIISNPKPQLNLISLVFCGLFTASTSSAVAQQSNASDNAYALLYQQVDVFKDDLDDDFADIEAKLESQFLQTDAQLEARYQAVHKAIQAAYTKQTAKIEVQWPNDVVVPKGALWVAYSEDYKERVSYDFEQGYYQLEVVDDGDVEANLNTLSKMATKVSLDKASTLASLDVFSRAIEAEVAKIEPASYQQQEAKVTTNTPANSKALDLNQNVRRGMFKLANYEIMASVSAPAPNINVQQLLTRLAKEPANLAEPSTKQANKDAKQFVSNKALQLQTNNTNTSAKALANRQNFEPIALDSAGNVLTINASKTPVIAGVNNRTKAVPKLSLSKTTNGWALKIPFVNKFQQTLIDQRMQTIKTMSQRFDVDVSIILAIIESESSFNPMATSHIPAFGLMQLVPKTAGVDAYHHVYGKHKILSPDYLYDIENNLELGTAYIDVLQTRYLRGIDNPDNKLYSMIASYNTGVGNLASTVSGKKAIRGAIPYINEMQPTDYYKFLQKNLPAVETRRYLDKVISKRQKYQHLDEL